MWPIALGVSGFAALLGVPAVVMALTAGSPLEWCALAVGVGALSGYVAFGRNLFDYYPGGKATRSAGSWTRFLPLITVVTPVVTIVATRSNPHAATIVGSLVGAWGCGFILGILPVWKWPEMARRRPGAKNH